MELDVRAARVSRRQYGLITSTQALGLGFTHEMIDARRRQGVWFKIRHGVYVVGGVPPSWEQAILAVVLPFDDCWVAAGTGARLFGLPRPPEIGKIEVLRPYGKRRALAGVTSHRSRLITPGDLTRHKRIPVTSRGRTIVDCSERLTAVQTGHMIDAGLRVDRRTLEDTRAAFARLSRGGRRQLVSARDALVKRLPGYDPGESDLEIATLATILDAGLPMPVQQHRVTIRGKRYRIDLAYPHLMIAIELVGWTWHGGRGKFDEDKARAADLVSMGWRHMEITTSATADEVVTWVGGAIDYVSRDAM